MRKRLAAATVAASITIGGFAGAVLGVPGPAGAAETAASAASWLDEALGGLVEDGTITQDQADAVETALEEARPERGPRRGLHHDGEAVATALGMTAEELRAAVEDGATLAEIAGEQGIAVEAVIDAIVADHADRLAEKVTDGELTQAEADERLEEAEERATAMVNGEGPERGRGHRGPRRDA